jgi:hypothetical protein
MVEKRLLCPERERRVPRQFSWVDQGLVSKRQLERCSVGAWGLYLFLVLVGDSRGLSYYSDASVCAHLSISSAELERLRSELCAAGMLAYQKPLYQILSLLSQQSEQRARSGGEAVIVAEVLRRIATGVRR